MLHGDEFDYIVRNNKWLAHIGDGAYDFLLWLNHWFNLARRRLGFSYWSLSAFLKQQTKSAVNFIGNFEESVCREAKRRSVDGVICGHIHHATLNSYDGCEYKNCGDWVESCTALVEDRYGLFQVLHWSERQETLQEEIPGLTWPNVTFKGEMRIWLGSVEVRLMQLGRGHTKGDTVAWLPESEVLFSGDLVEFGAAPYTGDAYLEDWPATLRRLAELEPRALVPGRGDAVVGKDKCQRLLEAVWGFDRLDSLAIFYRW